MAGKVGREEEKPDALNLQKKEVEETRKKEKNWWNNEAKPWPPMIRFVMNGGKII